MSAAITVVVLVEVHHLQSVELFRNLVLGLFLSILLVLDVRVVPRAVESAYQQGVCRVNTHTI